MLRVGERIGDWVVVSQLGEGGMGAVFLCHNALSERMKSAVKVLKSHELGDARERFIREMEALAALQHPAIVRVMGSGEDPEHGYLWMAMELLDGETLEDRINRGPIPWKEACALFKEVATGLAYAHGEGIRHRDIKPANIMVTAAGAVKVLDFGIAVQAGRTRLTNDRTVPGTLPYIPPEIFEGTKPEPVLADVYAAGLVLCEMLTGRTTYPENPDLSAGQRMAQIMAAKLTGGAVDPGNDLGVRALRQLISWATEPEPEDRLPEMAMFVTALDSILAGEIDDLPDMKRSDGVAMEAPPPGGPVTRKVRGPETFAFPLNTEEEQALSEELDYQPSGERLPLVAGVVGALALMGVVAFVVVGGGPDTPPKDTKDTVEEPLAQVPKKGPGSALGLYDHEMVPVKPGQFWMGSPEGEDRRSSDETSHPVKLTKPFLIGQTEVTQELYAAIMGENPSATQVFGEEQTLCEKWGVGDDHPVTCVTWEDAALFTILLSRMEGLQPAYTKNKDGTVVWKPDADGYRLPTEAEWEFAARAGSPAPFAGAETVDDVCKVANVANPETKQRNYAWLTWKAMDCDDGALDLQPVGKLSPNGLELYDMTGNVSEWVWDTYSDYPADMVTDPQTSTAGEERVKRGGDWSSGPKAARLAARDHAPADDRRPLVGFRLARNAE